MQLELNLKPKKTIVKSKLHDGFNYSDNFFNVSSMESADLCFETIDKYVQAQINKNPVEITGFDEQLAKIAELKAKKKSLEDTTKEVQSAIDGLVLPIIESMGQNTNATSKADGIMLFSRRSCRFFFIISCNIF